MKGKLKTIGYIVLVIAASATVFFVFFADSVLEKSKMEALASKRFSIGETVEFGKLSFTVTDVKEEPRKNGAKAVTVSVTVKNNNKEAASVYDSMFVLQDGSDNKYENSSSNINTSSLNPGLTASGDITFEVPESAANFTLACRTDMFDFGGADYVHFDLDEI